MLKDKTCVARIPFVLTIGRKGFSGGVTVDVARTVNKLAGCVNMVVMDSPMTHTYSSSPQGDAFPRPFGPSGGHRITDPVPF